MSAVGWGGTGRRSFKSLRPSGCRDASLSASRIRHRAQEAGLMILQAMSEPRFTG